MANKRIMLLLDGTWNDQDVGPTDTNIVRLQTIIARSVASEPLSFDAGTTDAKLVSGFSIDGVENIVYYERGVGTSAFDRIRGGAFGDGLALKVRRAYKFLSYHYVPGDSVFVFGFSRGAYTARSLVGYIGAAGLLQRKNCTTQLEGVAWNYYRTDPNDRLPGTWCELGQYTYDRDTFRIDCMAVFDTVGALGVPLDPFFLANRDRFAFHNVDLSSITKVNLHAVAIDEHRKPFEAALWRKPKFKTFKTATEQVWFSGAHSDIGGGYIPEEERDSQYPCSLDDITLNWLIQRLLHHFPKFPIKPNIWKTVDGGWSLAPHHEPRASYYRLFPTAFRAISNYEIDRLRHRQVEVSRDRHADPIGEMIHISVLERLGQKVEIQNIKRRYAPVNLIAVLPRIQETYTQNRASSDQHDLLIVDWNGKPIVPAPATNEMVNEMVTAARSRFHN